MRILLGALHGVDVSLVLFPARVVSRGCLIFFRDVYRYALPRRPKSTCSRYVEVPLILTIPLTTTSTDVRILLEMRGITYCSRRLPVAGPPLDLSRLLKSNEPPLPAHVSSIRQAVTFSQLRVDALIARIATLKASMPDQLIEERDETADRLTQYTGVLSAVRRIPPELICEILSWASPRTRNIGENIVAQPPLHLGHICRSWRDTALAYPFVWNSFHILHSWAYPHQAIHDRNSAPPVREYTPLVLDFQ
jgi:hypothetical protein